MTVSAVSADRNSNVAGDRISPGGFDYDRIQGVRGNPHVTEAFIRRVEEMAERLGTRPEYLMAVMSFETGGTFRPDVRNAAGSGATGLIQFMPGTARELGTSTDALARMSAVEQLEYVERYFARRSDPGDLNTLEGVYTTVLYGSPRPDPNSTLFAQGTAAYRMNAPLDINRDGRITAGEATSFVRARIQGEAPPPTQTPPRPEPPASPPPGRASTYTVRSGDTLSGIAERHGVSLDALLRANPQIRNPNLIHPGQSVNLPGGGSAPPRTEVGPPRSEGAPPAPPSGEAPTYAPFTVYSTGHRPAFAVSHPDQMQPHHDYQTRVREGQTLEVRDVVLHRAGQSQTQQPIPSPIAGTVVHAGPLGAAGNAVILRGDNGQLVYIFHMSSIDVREGQRVGYGQDLGNQGSTGHSTGPHVHIEAPSAVIDRWVNDLLDGRFDGRRG